MRTKTFEIGQHTNKLAFFRHNNCLHNLREFDRLKKPPKIVVLLCDPTLRAYSDYREVHYVTGFRPVSKIGILKKRFYEGRSKSNAIFFIT